MLVTYWLHKCPRCGVSYTTTWFTRGRGMRLGPGYRVCRSCGHAFDDGSLEWPEMSVLQRIAVFLPRITWPFVLLLLLMPVPLLSTRGTAAFMEALVLAAVGFAAFAILFTPYWVYRVLQVRDSRRRVARTPGRALISPGAAALLIIVVAGAVIAGGMFGIIPNPYATRVIEEFRGRTEAKLARMEAIGRAVPRDVVSDAAWDEATVVKLTGVAPTAANIVAFHVENLSDLTRNFRLSRALPILFCGSWDPVIAASLVRNGRWHTGERIGLFDSSDRIREAFQRFDQARYLLVVRAVAYEPPPALDRPGSFTSGHYSGEALLYAIETGRPVGGVRFGARNSREITGTGALTIETLERNLSYNAGQAMVASLGDHLPRVAGDQDAPCLVP